MTWTNEKNQRRCLLVDKEIDGTLSPTEHAELEQLQSEMLAYRRKVAPLDMPRDIVPLSNGIALKIRSIALFPSIEDGKYTPKFGIVCGGGWGAQVVSLEWVLEHKPLLGGWLIINDDKSYSYSQEEPANETLGSSSIERNVSL